MTQFMFRRRDNVSEVVDDDIINMDTYGVHVVSFPPKPATLGFRVC